MRRMRGGGRASETLLRRLPRRSPPGVLTGKKGTGPRRPSGSPLPGMRGGNPEPRARAILSGRGVSAFLQNPDTEPGQAGTSARRRRGAVRPARGPRARPLALPALRGPDPQIEARNGTPSGARARPHNPALGGRGAFPPKHAMRLSKMQSPEANDAARATAALCVISKIGGRIK